MIVVMRPEASKEEIDRMIQRIESKGLKAILLGGTNRNVIAALGDKREVPHDFWESSPGVERVVPILAPYKLASREVKQDDTQVAIGSRVIGGKGIGVIAGPCTVESRDQIVEIAERVRNAGAIALRGGAYKPRTDPYSFQGLEEEGLEYLAEAREKTGLPIVTEVLSAAHVEVVARYADVLQIGARNMQNFLLLKTVGKTDKPVLLKRGLSATTQELLLAAEYILSQGNHRVILCERGIRTFEQHTRFTLSLTTVPYLKETTHLPVIVDPSHGTGRQSLVPPMAKAAVACGADALLIEVHTHPDRALVDGAQSLTAGQFESLMEELRAVAEALGRGLLNGRANTPADTCVTASSASTPGPCPQSSLPSSQGR